MNGKVVNVASVPQRSLFRYPGGKTWLVPRVREWLTARKVDELIEPFAGGGIVSLTAVAENLVDTAIMVELDEDVAAVWKTILGDDAEWLADQIVGYDLTLEHVVETLSVPAESTRDRAFHTILKNRTYRGGILAAGSAFIKSGENGKGISSRWYPETLYKRIMSIGHYKHRITFIEGDAFDVMEKNLHRKEAGFFVDPPYVKAGSRLYRYSIVDHERLFDLCKRVEGEPLMTYDNDSTILRFAQSRELQVRPISMKSTHHAEITELLIGHDLVWVDHPFGSGRQ